MSSSRRPRFGELPAIVGGLRSLGNTTPILNSWAGDGTYWLPKGQDIDEYYLVTYASIFGDDPSKAVKNMIASLKKAGAAPGTGGFVTGAAAIDGVVEAIRRAGGSTRRSRAREGAREVHPSARARRERQLLEGTCTASSDASTACSGSRTARRSWSARFGPRSSRRSRLAAAVEIDSPRRPGGSLRASSVSRSFTGVQALREVTLAVHRHEVVGLIGPNGAGKSTLVNLMSGFDTPTAGTIELEDRDVTRWSAHRRGRSGLARTFQHSRSFRDLSVRENVEVAALGIGARAARRRGAAATSCSSSSGWRGRAESPAGTLSHGDERRLGVARALATEPRFVLLDEPAAGLPEAEVPEFADVIRSIRDEHDAGVLLIDHNMSLVMAVCDRIHVLDQGRTLAEGPPAEIRANLDVAAAYLGESAVHEESG